VRSFLALVLVCAAGTAAEGQDQHDWQSLARLHAGDRIRVSLKTGPVEGAFQSWTPDQVVAGTVTARQEDVLKVERYRKGGGRGKHAAIGALIGFAGGFAIGAATGGNCGHSFGPCFSRGAVGGAAGGVGAAIGAGIGALIPGRGKELIYSAR
jgi:hypothetical protein